MEKQERKQRVANGQCNSKMMSFRIDAENVEFLNLQPNKGRLINELLLAEKRRRISENFVEISDNAEH